HPGNCLERIVVEAQHHFACETGAQDTLVVGKQCLANCVQPEISPAALVRYGKAIAADANFASPDDGKANASRPDDDDSSVSRAMRADAGDRRVMSINDRTEGVRPQHELLERAFAAHSGKADAGMHGAQRVAVKPGCLERDTTGFFHFDKRAIDS